MPFRWTGFADCSLVGPHGARQGPTPVASKRYQRHEAEGTPLYERVAAHLESFLAEARETHERALPQYVERELREYLAGFHEVVSGSSRGLASDVLASALEAFRAFPPENIWRTPCHGRMPKYEASRERKTPQCPPAAVGARDHSSCT